MLKHKVKKGFTLLEVILTSIIALMLTGTIFIMLIKAKSAWQSSITRTASRQELQVVSWQIAQELQGSNIDSITNVTTGNLKAFSYASAYDQNGIFVTNASGFPVWQKYNIYYVPEGTKKLTFKEVYKEFGESVEPLTPQELITYCAGSGKLISPSITKLNLETKPENNSAVLTLETETVNLQGKSDRQSLSLNIFVYNN